MRAPVIITGLLFLAIGASALVFTAVKATDVVAFKESLRRQMAAAIGRGVDMETVEISFGWPPRLLATNVRLGNTIWAGDKPMAAFARVEGEIDPWSLLIGAVQVRDLTLFDGQIDLIRAEDGSGNWSFDLPGIAPASAPEAFRRLEALTLRRVNIEWQDQGVVASDTFRIVRAELTFTALGELVAQLSGAWNDNPFEAEVVVPSWPTGAAHSFRPKIDGKIIGIGFNLDIRSIDARRLSQAGATVRINGRSLADVGLLWGIQVAPTPEFSASATLRIAEGILNLEQLRGRVGQSDIGGRIRIGNPEGRHRVEADLFSQSLSVGDLPNVTGALILSWITHFDSEVQWRADAFQIGEVTAASIHLQLESDRDGIIADITDASIGDGTITLTAQLHAAGPDAEPIWTVDGNVRAISISDAFGIFSAPPVVEAPMTRGEFELKGPGPSLGAWLSGLSGEARFLVGSGRLASPYAIYVPGSHRDFNCAAGEIDVDRGLMLARRLIMDAGADITVLEGGADLRGGIWDARVLSLPKEGGSPILAHAMEIFGPLQAPEAETAPDVVIDPEGEIGRSVALLRTTETEAATSCQSIANEFFGAVE